MTYSVSLNVANILYIWIVLLIFKTTGILDNFHNISVSLEKLVDPILKKKILDHILETPRPVIFGVKYFNCDDTKWYLQNIHAWNKDDIEVVI